MKNLAYNLWHCVAIDARFGIEVLLDNKNYSLDELKAVAVNQARELLNCVADRDYGNLQ
jgi:hypothetical protein